MPKPVHTSDGNLAFAYQLRDAVTRYLAAVDAWERQHGKSYRLPSRSAQVTGDLETEAAAYRQARTDLEVLVPRARALYHTNGIRDPFNALLRVNLGAAAPQGGTRAAIGGNERTDVARGLVDLIAACAPVGDSAQPENKSPSRLSRILNFFK
jgi:hypothetical protein